VGAGAGAENCAGREAVTGAGTTVGDAGMTLSCAGR
jgi:hypothetical protein